MKVSHRDLETCLQSPKLWLTQLQAQSGGSGPRFGYNQALSYAICELHKANSLKIATEKLEGYLENFKNEKKKEDIRDRLLSYAKWLEMSGVVPIDSNVTINYPFQGDWHLGGMISRVDILEKGYRAILFGAIPTSWKDQLRMPLIQLAIADRYGRPSNEVRVGFQDIDTNVLDSTRYANSALKTAQTTFEELGNKVRKLLPPTK